MPKYNVKEVKLDPLQIENVCLICGVTNSLQHIFINLNSICSPCFAWSYDYQWKLDALRILERDFFVKEQNDRG